MADMKTKPGDADVEAFLAGIDPPGRGDDARAIAALMARVTGLPPVMWGPSIVGFGRYHYRYDSGREGEMCRIGFSPRKAALTLYLKLGAGDQDAALARLGKHTTGKGCLYIKKLADVDLDVLGEIVAASWEASRIAYPGPVDG